AADKSLSRGGIETIFITNAVVGPYYIGVKSEDAQAAQYTLTGLFSQLPFGNFDNQGNGSNTICGPFLISDGTPEHPGGTNITLFINANMTIHRVIVSDSITHQLMGDLVGTIANPDGSSAYAVLNNHSPEAAVTNKTYLFDDSLMMNVPGARHS